MTNYNSRGVTYESVMRRSDFIMGYKDYINNDPIRDDKYLKSKPRRDCINRQWDYERGRLFAAYCSSVGVRFPTGYKSGHKVKPEAVELFKEAYQSKAIL